MLGTLKEYKFSKIKLLEILKFNEVKFVFKLLQ